MNAALDTLSDIGAYAADLRKESAYLRVKSDTLLTRSAELRARQHWKMLRAAVFSI